MLPIDFENLKLPDSPNFALIAPTQYESERAFMAPVYICTIEQLEQVLVDYILQQPRITVILKDKAAHEFSFIQKTALFRFPDQIDLKVVSISPESATFIMLSRSKYGYYDFGKNKGRMRQWLRDIKKVCLSSSCERKN